jgi:hypothetical protein
VVDVVSSHGRAQDALHDLWEHETGYGPSEPGIAQDILGPSGVTWREWNDLIEPILEAVEHIFVEFGKRCATP